MNKAAEIQKRLGWSSVACGKRLLGIDDSVAACKKWCAYKRSDKPTVATSVYFNMILAAIKIGVLDELLKAMEGKR